MQLLQLVHGEVDAAIRVRDTTSAIAALSEAGYIGRADARQFDEAYRYLRVLEHRIQLVQLRRTHLMPLRALNRDGSGSVFHVAEATAFADANGADVINLSLGAPRWSKLLRKKVNEAITHGSVVVAAAGKLLANLAFDEPAVGMTRGERWTPPES